MTILIGLLAGAHTSSWGMYKDAPHEGFTLPKYFRSIVVATLVAIAIDRLTGFGPDTFAHAAVFFGMVYAGERLLVELWKTFIREEDQSKYFIPMQFGVFGKPIKSRAVRWAILAAVVAVITVTIWAVTRLQAAYPDAPKWLVILLTSAGGWFSAFGGAWKDAPVEGFETFKFFRSPFIAMTWSTVMAFLDWHWVFIGLAGSSPASRSCSPGSWSSGNTSRSSTPASGSSSPPSWCSASWVRARACCRSRAAPSETRKRPRERIPAASSLSPKAGLTRS
jgi:hypothetical protein